MPATGLYRADRLDDLRRFPPPALPLGYRGEPVYDGFRWEDIRGEFSTLKLSRSAEAAVGRAVANYRDRVLEGGVSLVDEVVRIPSDDARSEPELQTNRIPPGFFDDFCLQHLPQQPEIEFVDLADPRTHQALAVTGGAVLRALGVERVNERVVDYRNRRVTAAIVRILYELCSDERYTNVAGLRYRGWSGKPWDAYVVWNRPDSPLLSLDSDDVQTRTLSPSDPEVVAACATLGLERPHPVASE